MSATNPNLLEEGRIALVSTDCSSLEVTFCEVFETAGNIWEDEMGTEEWKRDLASVKELEQNARDSMEDLQVSDITLATLRQVQEDLKEIRSQVKEFRRQVRVLKQKYAETLNVHDVTALDTQVEKLLEESKQHNSLIWHKIQEIAPYKPMTEFEEKSLQEQQKTREHQMESLEMQRTFQTKMEQDKKTEEMAKIKTSNEKVQHGCSQLVVDVHAGDGIDDWTGASDEKIRKAMNSKEGRLKKIHSLHEEFLRYKTLITTWSPEMLDDEQSAVEGSL